MNKNNEINHIDLKIVVLEDSRQDVELITAQFSLAGYIVNVSHAENERDFRALISENQYDVILSDFNMPGFDAFGALEISNELCPDVPFICISGSIGEETAIELLKKGAVDYVLKDRPERLPFALKRALDEAKTKAAHLKADLALQESENRFKQVAEVAQEWIWEVDKEGLYTYSSPLCYTLLGYFPDEIVGKKHFYDFFLPEKKEELMKFAFEMFSGNNAIRHFENQNLHKNGEAVYLLTSGSPVFDENGNLKGYRGVDTDITAQKKLMQELVLAKEKAEQSDKLKTAFLKNISHEIRTPLNGIMGFGQLLADSQLSEEERAEYIEFVNSSSTRLMNTITDYLDMARIASGSMEIAKSEFTVQAFFYDIAKHWEQLCAQKNIDFHVVIPPGQLSLTLYSDQEVIRRIVHILLDNALKFTVKGKISCGYSMQPGCIEFFVEDSGTGVAADKLELIFHMFSQADFSDTRGHEGSGLGLTIARSFVGLLGGEIKVTSEKNKGSVFTFTIPTRTGR